MISEETRQNLILNLLGIDKPTREKAKEIGEWKIVVLQKRGWVVVGQYYEDDEYQRRLENSSVIRRWGTTKGLGELAKNGPLTDTKLDPCGTVRYNIGAEVCRVDCKTENWS